MHRVCHTFVDLFFELEMYVRDRPLMFISKGRNKNL